MSGAPKRGAHEEGVHSSSSSMRPGFAGEEEENSGFPRVNYGAVQESTRPGLLPRPEFRDGERRSPLHSVYKMPLSSINADSAHATHPIAGPEIRTEVRDSKEIRESKGGEGNRDVKVESREVHHQAVKAEKESRVDESKEGKHERDIRNDLKSEVKVDKDVYGGSGSHTNWKEQYRGKKHSDVPGGGGMPNFWMNATQMRPKFDPARDAAVAFREISEAVGENRVDLKSDDKFKEKERKRKEGKHHDWPESDKDKSDHKSNVQAAGTTSNNVFKEVIREERESEQEGRIGGEKENHQNEKEIAEKTSVQENFPVEQKKPTESWRNMEREAKERRKERDADLEAERPEKRTRVYDKESEEGGADVDGAADREKDTFSYGVQQRKRMLRPRGSPQVANRDGRFKSRGQDGEGSQGKTEVSTVYKVGECMQELTKLWREYESSQADKSSDNLSNGPTLEIRIPAEHVTATNRQVRGGQLWGTDIYTDDSDLVAGYCRPTASPPPAAIQELRATIRILPPQDSYVSTLRNNVRSRAWGAAIGCSFRVERCCIMKKGGGSIDLEPCLTHTSTIEPTLAPVAVERSMTTRAAASNALRQQRFVREVTIQYNLCNEPWYELCFTGEKIVKVPSVSQAHEAESDKSQNHVHTANGERSSAEGDNMVVDMFRWSKCKKPLPQKFMRSIGIPLPLEHVEVLEENLDWEDVQWSQTGVWVSGKEYPLARVHFLSPN
uniref:Uncharacterized protein n=1 Tax=Chenopodium quinoa TaxID=63459 RepID=A0A803L504_CHEQI